LKYRPFNEARHFVQTLGIKNEDEWKEYCKSGKKPENIPKYPKTIYKNEWKGLGDWLGTGTTSTHNRSYRPFEDARSFVQTLNLKNQSEWSKYARSKDKPQDIPADPRNFYKEQWKGYGDWLGTGHIAPRYMVYRLFEDAKKFVYELQLKSSEQWKEYCKSGKKPMDIPANPSQVYNKEWKGFGDWLGTGNIASYNIKFLPYSEAKKVVHSLNLKSTAEWERYCKSGKKPANIPVYPEHVYQNEWKGWGDWLGLDLIIYRGRRYIPFEHAKKIVRKLGIVSYDEWWAYCNLQKPGNIPSYPNIVYREQWKGWGDWLGTGNIVDRDKIYLPFIDAKRYVQSLKLKDVNDWVKYWKSGRKPNNVPNYPDMAYREQWKGWGDWLGTRYVANQNRIYKPFEEAKKYVHSLGLKNLAEWEDYCKSGKKPADIPAGPSRPYKEQWKGWGDWLGTGTIAPKDRKFRPFEEARTFARSLGLKSKEDWANYCKSGRRPHDIPQKPYRSYNKDWVWWGDWLGYENPEWVVRRVKELLQDLIKSGIIYNWNEAVLYSFLLRKGVLNLGESNRHSQFFKNLIEASRTTEGRKALEEYANSDSEIPPDLSVLTSESKTMLAQDTDQEIESASPQEISNLVENTNPLDYGEIKTAEQILAQTNVLESINVDEEAMQFYIDYSIDELWKSAFRDKEATVLTVKRERKNGNKYHDTVAESFLTDYEGTQNIVIPPDYSFPHNPTLMQLYVAYKVKTDPYFGNFSGMGAGKTLSAVLASRMIDSKMTLIICPNDVVNQWARSIIEIFPDSHVITGKEAFYQKYNEIKHQYLVLNYDKFSQEDSPNLILNLAKQKVDFVVLDEIHFVKKRDEESSQRRKNLDGLMTAVRKKNKNLKVLGLSATPVVNNLMEGRSLLELITGKIYDDVATTSTIPNAVTLYEKLSLVSIRELPKYNADVHTEHIDVKTQIPRNDIVGIKELKRNPLTIERFFSDAKIPEIIRHIEGQTIIYTEYVTDIIEKLCKAVESAGYSYALYTGSDHSGLKRFLDKKVQVLIASRPISTGVDGLQNICNRLIINTLPWTNAQYQQLLGRLVRKGQIRDVVHVFIVKANVNGYPYDQLKWNRIQFKRTLADCAVDGRLPEKNLVTPQQAALEAVKWLERLERGEVSSVVRRDLEVELTPVEIELRVRKYGDFTRLNNQINTENSETTHKRMLKDPREWEEYHRQYREARKSWNVIPYEEIIKRIKQLSPRLQIGDFGCGEAKIMEAIGAQRVYSFDHVAINDKVTTCDMKKVPLADEALDVAVFSLSLMGKNWHEYIKEAKRCLVTNGILIIAETTKSLKGRLSDLRDVIKAEGFETYLDEERGDFTFIEAREL
jgi:superfamily II DNA or RNA helicase